MPAGLLSVLAAITAGLASAALAAMLASDSPLRLLLFFLAPLPLFASGLSGGILAAVAAALTGAVAVSATLDAGSGLAYLVVVALPVALLVRLALKPRRTQQGLAWTSGSRLLVWLGGAGVATVVGVVAYFALFGSGLAAAIEAGLGLAVRHGVMPQALPHPGAAAAMLARIVPGLAVGLWMIVLIVDGMAAEWLLAKLKLAIRPPIDIAALRMPLWVGPVFLVAGLAGAVFRQGPIGIACLNSAIVLVVAFAFVGLATAHVMARSRPGGPALAAVIYLLLFGGPALLGWQALLIMFLMLAGMGAVDQWLDWRGLRGLRQQWKK